MRKTRRIKKRAKTKTRTRNVIKIRKVRKNRTRKGGFEDLFTGLDVASAVEIGARGDGSTSAREKLAMDKYNREQREKKAVKEAKKLEEKAVKEAVFAQRKERNTAKNRKTSKLSENAKYYSGMMKTELQTERDKRAAQKLATEEEARQARQARQAEQAIKAEQAEQYYQQNYLAQQAQKEDIKKYIMQAYNNKIDIPNDPLNTMDLTDLKSWLNKINTDNYYGIPKYIYHPQDLSMVWEFP